MNEARGNHGATLLRNGNVLVEGGTWLTTPPKSTIPSRALMVRGGLHERRARLVQRRAPDRTAKFAVSGDGNPDVEL